MDGSQMGGPAQWAASSAVGPNASYLSQTLRYNDVELSFSEAVSIKTVLGLWATAALTATGITIAFGFIPFLLSGFDWEASASGFALGGFIGFFTFWLILLFTSFTEPSPAAAPGTPPLPPTPPPGLAPPSLPDGYVPTSQWGPR